MQEIQAAKHLGFGEVSKFTIYVANISRLPLPSDAVQLRINLGTRIVPKNFKELVVVKTNEQEGAVLKLVVPLAISAQSRVRFRFKVRLHEKCQLFEVHPW